MTPASKASSTGSRTAAKGKATNAPAKKAVAKKSPAKKAVAKKSPAKKSPAKKSPAKKSPAKKAPMAKVAVAKKAPAKKAVAKKSPAKKAPVAKAPAKKAPAAKVVVAKKAAPVTAPAKKAAPVTAPAKKAAPVTAPAKKAAPRARPTVGPYASDTKFLEEQRLILLAEKDVYQEQANMLKAEADSLAHEREPGDVQFDEESGEGGTVTVDRERDLALSAQASLTVEEIEDALVRVTRKTYGACERCHQPIMKARLRAVAYARLCVACKSGGLSRR